MILIIISLFNVAIINTSSILPGSEKFFSQVLSDFDRHSLFVACEINSPGYSGKVVIENADLFACLSQQKGFSRIKYKSYMLQKLLTGGKIDIKSDNLLKWGFLKVNEMAEVKQQISDGDEEFIRNFFSGKVIKEGLGFDVRNAIIYELFKRQISSKTDDETGYLYIP